jgi:hypothetical protein
MATNPSKSTMSYIHCFRLLAAIVLCSAAIGCGRSGPARFDLSGKVTFRGQPVPVGTISFLPDGNKGNKGPVGFAKVADGVYDTRRQGRGACGGPLVVVISGFTGKAVPGKDEMPLGSQVFPDYRVPFDMSPGTTTKDFDVPAPVR